MTFCRVPVEVFSEGYLVILEAEHPPVAVHEQHASPPNCADCGLQCGGLVAVHVHSGFAAVDVHLDLVPVATAQEPVRARLGLGRVLGHFPALVPAALDAVFPSVRSGMNRKSILFFINPRNGKLNPRICA